MSYNPTPFNYYGSSSTQILHDLNQANENFASIANAFVNGTPDSGTVLYALSSSLAENLSVTVSGLSTSVNNLSVSAHNLSVSLNNTSTSVNNLSTSLGNVSTSLGNVSTSVNNLSTSLGNVSTSLGNVSTSVNNLSTSLGNVSTSLGNVSTSLGNVSTSLGNVSTTVGNHSTSLQTLSTSLNNVSTSLGNVSTSLNHVSTTVGNLSISVNNISTSVSNNTNEINSLSSSLQYYVSTTKPSVISVNGNWYPFIISGAGGSPSALDSLGIAIQPNGNFDKRIEYSSRTDGTFRIFENVRGANVLYDDLNAGLQYLGNTVWHNGNVLISNNETSSIFNNGYTKLPNNMILQWGVYSTSFGANGTISFPVAFNNVLYNLIVSLDDEPSGQYVLRYCCSSLSSFSYYFDNWGTKGSGSNVWIRYIAIGE